MSMLIFDHKRGKYWNQNKFGYTDNVDDAGRFNYDEARTIMENANVVNINTSIFSDSDIKEILKHEKLLNKNSIRERRDLGLVLSELSTKNEYDKTNPFGRVVDKLIEEGYYVDDSYFIDPTMYNEQGKIFNLEIKNAQQNVRLSIYRMSSGNYEVSAYATQQKIEIENKARLNKNKVRP